VLDGEGVAAVSDRVRLLLSLLSGGLLALAFPGTGDQGWLAFTALAPLLVALEPEFEEVGHMSGG
jgi:apolipoprotein N-acyltransferase